MEAEEYSISAFDVGEYTPSRSDHTYYRGKSASRPGHMLHFLADSLSPSKTILGYYFDYVTMAHSFQILSNSLSIDHPSIPRHSSTQNTDCFVNNPSHFFLSASVLADDNVQATTVSATG
jgi:hypothetical protein